ncbi:hypothetical protein [Sphingobacterium sp. LRF_L2]|uniref:hypothetical protein n=1 Tax=Sphingobacterium sp. LRF_L2 TaxID=3369421 RepID=UPI003F619786
MNEDKTYRTFSRKTQVYQIAGIGLELTFPDCVDIKHVLPSFADFFEITKGGASAGVQVEITFETFDEGLQDSTLLSEESLVWGDYFQFRETTDAYFTCVSTGAQKASWYMKSSKDFATNSIYAVEEEMTGTTVLSWLLMVAFAQGVLKFSTILIHASVVEGEGMAVAFLGKSGTGKSTHSRLWLQHNTGFHLLNDDNPAVRIGEGGKVHVYGTPWSGKTHCYRNLGLPLAAVVRLSQAKQNQFSWKKGKEALITLLPSGSALRWNTQLFSAMTSIFQVLSVQVPIGHLACLPDAAAARLCYAQIIEQHTVNE